MQNSRLNPDLSIQTYFLSNSIVLISATNTEESGLVRRLKEDLEMLCGTNNYKFLYYEIKSSQELINTLKEIAQLVKNGLLPIIHLESHGDKENGIEIGMSKEMVSWQVLVEPIRNINVLSKNNLCMVITACFGFYAIRPTSIDEPTPFFMLISPDKAVIIGHIADKIIPFYREIMSGHDVVSCANSLGSPFRYYHCEQMLARALIQYIKESCIGKGAKERRDNLLKEAILSRGLVNNRYNRRRLKKEIDDFIKPRQSLIDQYAPNFLCNKDHNLTIGPLIQQAEKLTE